MVAEFERLFFTRGAQKMARKVLDTCVRCRRHSHTPFQAELGPIHASRLLHTAKFAFGDSVNIDFAGPMCLMQGPRVSKAVRYLLVIVCGWSRAVHVEPVEEITSWGCLRAFATFTERWGVPKEVICDNQSSFVKLEKQLAEAFWETKQFQEDFAVKFPSVKWTFVSPKAAWQNGACERFIGSVKAAFKDVTGEDIRSGKLRLVDLPIVLARICRIINMRPLCPGQDVATDPTPLRPIDFMGMNVNDESFIVEQGRLQVSSLATKYDRIYRHINACIDRWEREYKPTLKRVNKWIGKDSSIALAPLLASDGILVLFLSKII